VSASKPHSEQLETRWMLLRAHVEEHGTHLEVLHELLDRVVGLEEQLEAARLEAKEARIGELHAGDHAEELKEQLEALHEAVLQDEAEGTFPHRTSQVLNPASRPLIPPIGPARWGSD